MRLHLSYWLWVNLSLSNPNSTTSPNVPHNSGQMDESDQTVCDSHNCMETFNFNYHCSCHFGIQALPLSILGMIPCWLNAMVWQLLSLFLQLKGPMDHSHFDFFPPDTEEPPDELSGWDKDFWGLWLYWIQAPSVDLDLKLLWVSMLTPKTCLWFFILTAAYHPDGAHHCYITETNR